MSQAWWRGAVIYQVYVRSFLDTDGDGVGDLPGVIARLPYLAGLGVDALWLTPIFPSPQADFGYDVADYTGIDPAYGTLADFDALIARAHALGMRVILDQVWSHTSDEHPWFASSRAGRRGPHADWYVWANPSADGTPPTNWLSAFGGGAWDWDARRGQYYLHHFLPRQPTLNLRHPAVMEALLESGKFWLDRGVDGFRLDAVDFFAHDPGLTNNPAAPPQDPPPRKLFGRQLHFHDMLHPDTAGLLGQIRALTDAYPGTCTLGEVSSQPGAFGRIRLYTDGDDALHMAYTLQPLRAGFDLGVARALVAELSEACGWPCIGFSNHDVERVASRWGVDGRADPARTRMLLALLFSLRGSVTLYQGEELGLPEATVPREAMRDPFGLAYWPVYPGRDGARTPMPWTAGAAHGGFTEGTPWLPVPPEHRALAVDRQARPDSVLAFTRRLLAWRNASPAIRHGAMRPLPADAPFVALERREGEERVTAVFNVSDAAATGMVDGERMSLEAHGFVFVPRARAGRRVGLAYA